MLTQGYEAWASDKDLSLGGFPLSNLLQTSASPSDTLAVVAGAVQQIPGALDGVLIVASLDSFFGPSIPVQSLLEHTVVRGKTTLAFVRPLPGHSLHNQAELVMDVQGTITVTGEYTNPKGA